MTAPLAPHITEELWPRLGHPESLAHGPFPVGRPGAAGRRHGHVRRPGQGQGAGPAARCPPTITEDDLRELAMALPRIAEETPNGVRTVIVRPPSWSTWCPPDGRLIPAPAGRPLLEPVDTSCHPSARRHPGCGTDSSARGIAGCHRDSVSGNDERGYSGVRRNDERRRGNVDDGGHDERTAELVELADTLPAVTDASPEQRGTGRLSRRPRRFGHPAQHRLPSSQFSLRIYSTGSQ